MQLTPVEARVLGALMEKETSTPEYYPLSLHALLAAANQKSAREPVMTLSEEDVRGALRSLEDQELVSVDHGSRVQRYAHRARTVFHLRRDETAILCLLLLRGPQTPGELRGRADRLHSFEDTAAVAEALRRMSAPSEQRPEAVVIQLARQPGTKEQRYTHALGSLDALAGAASIHVDQSKEEPNLHERVAQLEREMRELRELVRGLQTGLQQPRDESGAR